VAQVGRRDHRHDAARLEIGAALTALEALGVDLIGLNCSTGPAEMSEHLRTLSKHAGSRCR
jgi:methionine synthase I (cobalamin-dependent)